ncbi:MAG TPA: amidohydrolase [Bacteroidales bacterium]|nr:amidohydrolase [Bacteroidales bacterium]
MSTGHLVKLRRELHSYPEIAGHEKATAEKLKEYISQYKPDRIITGLGGHGIAFIYKGEEHGKKILFRADLDALPIKEISERPYRSVYTDRAHLCGHDGHITILAGLAEILHRNRPLKGEIILLFQPSEETGEGATMVLSDNKFREEVEPDYVFALHNLPGYPENTIIIKDSVFNSASVGLTVSLHGKSSHAAEPLKGDSPVKALYQIITALDTIQSNKKIFSDFVLGTVIHINVGEKRFGTSPEYGEISMTLRAYRDDDIEILKKEIIQAIINICKKEEIKCEYEWEEEFISLRNAPYPVEIIKEAAYNLDLQINEMTVPLRWSEDFSHFTKAFPGAMFGLGAGINHPALHNPDYDFPDKILATGINMFLNIYRLINEK